MTLENAAGDLVGDADILESKRDEAEREDEWLRGLSVRTLCCLQRAGIETREQLASTSETDLLAIADIGPASVAHIRQFLLRGETKEKQS
jgi:DNA-directed RNA polymerase alpha subunit